VSPECAHQIPNYLLHGWLQELWVQAVKERALLF